MIIFGMRLEWLPWRIKTYEGKLRWFVHVKRRGVVVLVKRCKRLAVMGVRRCRGRSIG